MLKFLRADLEPVADRRVPRLVSPLELFSVLAIFIGLTWLESAIRVAQTYHNMGDTLIYQQVVDNIAHGRGAISSVFSSTQQVIDTDAQSKGPDAYLKIAESFDPSSSRNILHFHSYFILFLLAVFRLVASAASIIATADALSFIGMIAVVYIWLRYRGVDWAAALFFTVLVMLHPAWGVSITGQFYPDRLFLPLGLLFFVGLHERWHWGWLTLVGLLAVSLNERAPTVMGLFTLGYAVFFFEHAHWRRMAAYLAVGFTLLALGSALQLRFLDNLYYATFMPVSLADVMQRFGLASFLDKAIIFAMVNAGFVLLSVFRWRAVPVVLGLMIPNMVGNIGGAEKTGFPTHYHTYYFPSLIWGAALGYMTLHRIVASRLRIRGWSPVLLPLSMAVLCVPVILTHMVDWTNDQRPRLSWHTLASNNIMFTLPDTLHEVFGRDGAPLRQARTIARARVPAGSQVSATESAMWAAGDRSRVSIYPLGLADATYIVMNCDPGPNSTWTWKAVPSFLPPREKQVVEDAFKNRARSLGFDVDHPVCGPAPFNIGVIARAQKP